MVLAQSPSITQRIDEFRLGFFAHHVPIASLRPLPGVRPTEGQAFEVARVKRYLDRVWPTLRVAHHDP